MKIMPGSTPRPYNVEMPLACVLPDRLQTLIRNAEEMKRQEEEKSVYVEPQFGFWESLGKMISGTAPHLLPESASSSEVVKIVLEALVAPANRRIEQARTQSEELERRKLQTLRKVSSTETAYKHVLTTFTALQLKLNTEFPASSLEL